MDDVAFSFILNTIVKNVLDMIINNVLNRIMNNVLARRRRSKLSARFVGCRRFMSVVAIPSPSVKFFRIRWHRT